MKRDGLLMKSGVCHFRTVEIMSLKTLTDCAQCSYLKFCDAHITGGIHKHLEGTDPCQVSLVDRMQGRIQGLIS